MKRQLDIHTSLGWMESADAKIARAKEHATEFNAELERFYAQIKPNVALKTIHDGSNVLVFWAEKAYPPPIRLSILVGDWAYNLRSALDSIVCGMVRRRRPASECEGNKFPIYTAAKNYAASKRKGILEGVSAAAVKAIDALQPCERLDGTSIHHPLHLLNKLRNSDTHCSTLFTMAFAKRAAFRIHDSGGTHDVSLPPSWDLMSPATMQLPTLRSEAPRVEAVSKFELAFRDNRGPWGDRGVQEVMDACTRYVDEHVIPTMIPFFKS